MNIFKSYENIIRINLTGSDFLERIINAKFAHFQLFYVLLSTDKSEKKGR